jgi:hypothetical protein
MIALDTWDSESAKRIAISPQSWPWLGISIARRRSRAGHGIENCVDAQMMRLLNVSKTVG